MPPVLDVTIRGLSGNNLLPNPEPLLLLEKTLLLEYGVSVLSSLLDFNRENVVIMTAIKNIKPSIQNAMATLFGEMQKALSPGIFVKGYVSEPRNKKYFYCLWTEK